MKKTEAVAALAALAQDNRLDVFRLLVQGEGRFENAMLLSHLQNCSSTLNYRL